MNKLMSRHFLRLSALFLLCWTAVIGSAMAANIAAKPAFITPLAAKSLLTDIVKVGHSMVTVGDRGHILYSSDGNVWQQAKVPVNVLLTDVFFVDDKRGWAVGHDATILGSRDGGLSWAIEHYSPETDKPLFGIYFKDSSNGIAFGAYGMFLRTTDGGANWQKEFHGELLHPDDLEYINELKATDPAGYEDETSSILPHFNRLTAVGSTLYLVGEIGMVAKSDDFGAHWTKSEPFYNGSFFSLASGGHNDLYVAGLRGNIFRSTDFAQKGATASWQKLKLSGTTSINRIFSAGNKLVLVGNSGLFFTSSDGGQSFKSFSQSDGKAITGGIFMDNKLILSSEVGIKVIQSGQW